MIENRNSNIHSARSMSFADLASWCVPQLANVKRVVTNDEMGWTIHSADGLPRPGLRRHPPARPGSGQHARKAWPW